jgi:hypothetical protein
VHCIFRTAMQPSSEVTHYLSSDEVVQRFHRSCYERLWMKR